MGTITFLLVLSFLVFFHELGHFLAARFFGVKVEKFSIGFGKAIYSKYWAGTTWQFAMIPLGGYVQMKGQNDSNPTLVESGDDSYNTKKPWQRIIILFAGPFANFILAAILYFSIALMGAKTLAPVIGNISPNSVAAVSGLQTNDNQKIIKTLKEMANRPDFEDFALFVLSDNPNFMITLKEVALKYEAYEFLEKAKDYYD